MEKLKIDITTECKKNILHAVLVFIVLMMVFSVWVHHGFQGQYWGPFFPGADFGIPVREAEMGMYGLDPGGWDAQFYYYQSNDIFARGDGYLHIDNPAYRYQRIGVPLVASVIKTILGFNLTPPILYHGIQILMVSLGFYFLLSWLDEKKESRLLAYGWLLSVGVINSLAYGMPDPVGDALFIMSIIFAFRKKMLPYMISTCLLLLVREGYAIYAAIIFIGTVLKRIEWSEKIYWKSVLYTMIPGIVVVLWTLFVTIRFGKIPMLTLSGSNITEVPFVAIWRELSNAIMINNTREIFGIALGAVLLFVGILMSYLNRKISFVWYGIFVYCILLGLQGSAIWFHYSGYMKSLGSVIAVLVIGLPYVSGIRKRIIIVLLILLAIQGVGMNYYMKKDMVYTRWPEKTSSKESIQQQVLEDFNSKIVVKNYVEIWESNAGLFSNVHRGIKEIEAEITNTSDEVWYANAAGSNPVRLSYHIYDKNGENILYDGKRTELPTTLKPGETTHIKVEVLLPTKGEYLIRLSMVQEGVVWFYNVNESSMKDLRIIVD